MGTRGIVVGDGNDVLFPFSPLPPMNPRFLFLAVLALLEPALHSAAAETQALNFDLRSLRSGAWSDPQTWQPARVPSQGERVLVSAKTRVIYDSESEAVIRLI